MAQETLDSLINVMEQIVIADVWDTHREPKKVTRGL